MMITKLALVLFLEWLAELMVQAHIAGTESVGVGGPKEQLAVARVVILDFGRSSIGVNREEMDREITRLRRILRGG